MDFLFFMGISYAYGHTIIMVFINLGFSKCSLFHTDE